jgi:hypothetical protein
VDSAGGQVVLLSDGLATRGDAPQAAALLRARGLSVDVWPYVGPDVLDAALLAVDVPRALHAGEALPVGVDVRQPVRDGDADRLGGRRGAGERGRPARAGREPL